MKQIVLLLLFAGSLSGCVYSAESGYGGEAVSTYAAPVYMLPPPVYIAPPVYVPPPPPPIYRAQTTIVVGIGGGWRRHDRYRDGYHDHYDGGPPANGWHGRPPPMGRRDRRPPPFP